MLRADLVFVKLIIAKMNWSSVTPYFHLSFSFQQHLPVMASGIVCKWQQKNSGNLLHYFNLYSVFVWSRQPFHFFVAHRILRLQTEEIKGMANNLKFENFEKVKVAWFRTVCMSSFQPMTTDQILISYKLDIVLNINTRNVSTIS